MVLVGYSQQTGLVAQAGSNTAYLDVTVTPGNTGQKAWDLSIPSNDSDEPVVVVRIVADVQP